MTDIKAVIFDMGGVLVRCMRPHIRAALGQPYGLSREALEQAVFGSEVAALASVGKASDDEVWEHIRAVLGISPRDLHAFRDAFWSADDVDEQLVAVIKALRAGYRTGLLSNAWMGARASLTGSYPHLMDSFDVSIFSAEEGLVKPDAPIYHLMLDRLGVAAPQAVFVDDFEENIAAARLLGLHAIRFTSPQQALDELSRVVAW